MKKKKSEKEKVAVVDSIHDFYAGWVHVPTGVAREHLPTLLHDIENSGVGVVITRHERDIAVLVPISEKSKSVQADMIRMVRGEAVQRGIDPVEQAGLALMERVLRNEPLMPEELAMIERVQRVAQDAARTAFLDGLRREIGSGIDPGPETVGEDRAPAGADSSAPTGRQRKRPHNAAAS